jgi:hypothetical protein
MLCAHNGKYGKGGISDLMAKVEFDVQYLLKLFTLSVKKDVPVEKADRWN